MLISTRPPFVFCAFNKTGSTSIESALEPYNSKWRRWLLRRRYARLGQPVVFKHARPLVFRSLLGEKTWDRSFTFCFVRNPFARVVSEYYYQRQTIPDIHPLASQVGFEEWILAGGAGSFRRLMSEFVCDDEGRQILDFVGRFENLAEDFAEVCRRLGVNVSLPCLNPTRHAHYSEYYSDVARAEVERRFGPDLEMFGYSFERP